jgi:hypothetical protein
LLSGKVGFDDLKRVALAAMAQIAQASLRALFNSGGGAGGGGIGAVLTTALSSLVGAPGRSHGGPVAAGRGYLVGERGPELFVPSSGGRIEPNSGRARDVRVSINVSTPRPNDPAVLRQSSRQLARAVRSAMMKDR